MKIKLLIPVYTWTEGKVSRVYESNRITKHGAEQRRKDG